VSTTSVGTTSRSMAEAGGVTERRTKGSRFRSLLLIPPLLALVAALVPAAPASALPLPDLKFGTGTEPNSVAIGDLDGDGKPDLVSANADPVTVSVLLANGDGTFRGHRDYVVGMYPVWVTIGDLNGDGHPDLVTANGESNTVSVLLGNGN